MSTQPDDIKENYSKSKQLLDAHNIHKCKILKSKQNERESFQRNPLVLQSVNLPYKAQEIYNNRYPTTTHSLITRMRAAPFVVFTLN